MSTAITETLLSSIYIVCVFLLWRYEEDGIFISPICSHLADRITIHTSFGLFILGYFVSMFTLLLVREHLFVKGLCYLSIFRCLFYIGKEHSIQQYGSHFVNYSMTFVVFTKQL